MAWEGSTRRGRLPADWVKIRRRILARDPFCRLRYDCCTGTSTEVDHVLELSDDHRDEALQGACSPCHLRKSSASGGRAYKPSDRRKRAPEQHPGLRAT